MSYKLHATGFVILPIVSIERKPSVTQWRFTISASLRLMVSAVREPKRAGERQVTTGES
jgi:hypothetical protein